MQPKFQVFISSTYEDLQKAREQVIKATLEMGHIPVGMEMFSAADEQQWKVITRQIDQSDYYVVIVAHRYGSVVDGISFTEKEYDYAVQHGVPVIGFIVADSASWPANLVDTDPFKVNALVSFKSKVRQKPVGFWNSAEDLHGKYSIALMKLIATNPRSGWIRASDAAGPEVFTELSRLSSENAKLRARLAVADSETANERLAKVERTLRALGANKKKLYLLYTANDDYREAKKLSYRRIFEHLAPALHVECSTEEAAELVAAVEAPFNERNGLATPWPIPLNHIGFWLSDFSTLGLVKPSERKHSVKDAKEYWTLTEHGRDVYAHIRLQQLEAGEAIDSVTEVSTTPTG